ncbi:putative reverse transcriptase zinc-binding domain-containing protein [Rosa chinensis]|uniref:Putative reverse transcriptase zinc-binding domain-containing protein n=1 Tax=Rosa chinensis TaxID=74649 RepID=A0A2P6S902_ROSCH|nr:putative reverse transcriptase zinc-binding domain-containing protein [Rosa chinensis]
MVSLVITLWKFIWNLQLPPKLKTFTWIVCHDKILTNVQRAKRNLTNENSCPLCHQAPETLAPLFRDCPAVQVIWNSFNIPSCVDNTSQLNWNGWLMAYLLCKVSFSYKLQWNSMFVFICWYNWKWRN